MTGIPEGSTKSGFMEKPGIEPATPGLQGIALIHYTTGASLRCGGSFVDLFVCVCVCARARVCVCVLAYCDVCLLQSFGQLLGKCWPIGSLVHCMWCILCAFVTFQYRVLSQVWYMYLLASIPYFCLLSSIQEK